MKMTTAFHTLSQNNINSYQNGYRHESSENRDEGKTVAYLLTMNVNHINSDH